MTNGLYSKATRGLRQSDIIKDQQFKLVFVYPMLVDSSVTKYTDLLRNFLTTTMLKELFISNALNLVNIASQIHPLTDEKGKPVDVQSTVANASLISGGSVGQLGGGLASTRVTGQALAHPLEHMKYELAGRIREKTAIIRRYLASDPKLKALNPYVEMITMDNLVDVPVIVGTKSFDIDTATLQFVFLVSVAEKLSLKDPASIKKIFDKIKKTEVDDAWKLLNNLVSKKKKDPKQSSRITRWLKNLLPVRWTSTGYSKTKKLGVAAGGALSKIAKTIVAGDVLRREMEFDENESLQILQMAKSKLAQTELFFKFCYDSGLLKSQFGVDISQGQISTRVARVSGQIQNVFNNMYSDFVGTLTRIGNSAISSMINMLYPTESGLDELEVIKDFVFTRMLQNVRDLIFNDLMVHVNATIESGGIEASDTRIKELKGLCVGEFRDSDNVLADNNKDIMNNEITSPAASYSEMSRFMGVLSKVSSRSFGQSRDVEHALSAVLGGVDTTEILKRIYSTISTELSAMLDKLAEGYNRVDFNNVAFFRAVEADPNAPGFEFNQRMVTTIKTQLLDAIVPYIYFLFMYHLQIALCNYVSVVDVEIETAKNDVLDFPNYTLVVPLQTIESIASALVARSWKDLIQYDRGLVSAVGDSYAKGVVKHMKKRLGVPNLIVIDEQKGEVFYQLMHQSAPQKSKLKTLETFIRLTSKEELQGQLPGTAFPSGYY